MSQQVEVNKEVSNVKQDIRKMGYEERINYDAIKKLNELVPEFESLPEKNKKDVLTAAGQFVGEEILLEYLVKGVQKHTQANITNPRWIADAALKGIIGGAAFAGASAVTALVVRRVTGKTNPYSETTPRFKATPRPGTKPNGVVTSFRSKQSGVSEEPQVS